MGLGTCALNVARQSVRNLLLDSQPRWHGPVWQCGTSIDGVAVQFAVEERGLGGHRRRETHHSPSGRIDQGQAQVGDLTEGSTVGVEHEIGFVPEGSGRDE